MSFEQCITIHPNADTVGGVHPEVLIIEAELKFKENNIEDLVIRAKDGDSEAVNNIIERYKGLIIKEAARYSIPSYEFEDVIQHGYLTVIKSIKLYKTNSKTFNGYVINAIKNNIGYLLRGNIKHFREVPDDEIAGKCELCSTLTIEDQMIAYEQVKKLYAALDQLNEEERIIIEEFYIKETKLNVLGVKMNSSYRNLSYRKKKALDKLQKILSNNEKNE